MVASIPYHTHTFSIPTATASEITTGTSDSAVITPLGASTTLQPLNANLSAVAALTTAAYGRSLLESVSEAALKALINLEIGTDVQAYSANLTTLAGVTPGATGLALLDDTTAAAGRATLGFPSTASRYLKNDGSGVPTVLGATETTNLDALATSAASARDYLDSAPYVADDTALKALDTTKDTTIAYNAAAKSWFRLITLANTYDTTLSVTYAAISAVDGGGVIKVSTHDATKGWVREDFLHPVPLEAYWFGAIGDGSVSEANMLTYCGYIWETAKLTRKDMHFPAGLYQIGAANFPWRQSVVVSLLDCNNISLIADGPATIFKTASTNGADVFQINGLKNFSVRGYPTLTATASGSSSGSNGVSITNGGDNLYFEIVGKNLKSKDSGSVDGGKALTIQPSTTSLEVGRITAHVFATGCSYGFGADLDTPTMDDKKMSVDVTLHAEDCYRAVVISNGAPGSAISDNYSEGITVRGQAVNCQQDVVLARAFGSKIDIDIRTTKTAAARRLDPDGTAWVATDTKVLALDATMARHCHVRLTGDKGACDYKVRLGGTTAGSSGLSGRCEFSHFDCDIGGTAAAYYITYNTQTANFNTNTTLTGGTSGATAMILEDEDSGTTGTLWVRPISGTLQNAEIISDNGGSPGSATASAAPVLAEFRLVNSGGNYANNCLFFFTSRTISRSNFPSILKADTRGNILQFFDGWDRGITTLTDGATITPDFNNGRRFVVTLGGNRTMANPTGIADYIGMEGRLIIIQDGTGSRTLSWGTQWDFPAATAPTLTTTANAVDYVDFYVRSSTSIVCRSSLAHG